MNGLVLAQVWMNNQPVYFMTTLHRPQNKKVGKRKGEKNGTDIPDPPSVSDYSNMGGANYYDQIMKYYNCGRKSKKWYRHIFYHFFRVMHS